MEKIASLSSKEPKSGTKLTKFGDRFVNLFMKITHWSLKSVKTRLITIGTLAVFSITIVWALFPKMDYLPQGNKNLIFNILITPPGLSYEERYNMGTYLMKKLSQI